MPAFTYTAVKPGAGDQIQGKIDADTLRDARSKIRARGEVPVSITEIKVGGTGLAKYLPTISVGGFQKEVLIFTTQLSSLIRSGITLTEAIKVLSEQTQHREFSNILNIVHQNLVEKGLTFAESLKGYPKCFSPLYVSMIRAGESTGTLPQVLTRLATQAKKKEAIEGQVRSALTYPIIMCVCGLGVVIFLLSYLVPKIIPILKQQDKALPKATEILLAVSDFVELYWWVLIFMAGAMVFLYKWIVSIPRGRYTVDRLLLTFPIFGDLNRKAAVSRFCMTLSSLLKSGVKIEEALKIVEQVVGNAVVAETVDQIADKIREGESIAGPLQRNKVFPKVVTYMISIGEKAGSDELQEMLDNISDSYDVELEQSAEKLTSALNPILLIFLAGMVVFILLAILLPIMNMSSNL